MWDSHIYCISAGELLKAVHSTITIFMFQLPDCLASHGPAQMGLLWYGYSSCADRYAHGQMYLGD